MVIFHSCVNVYQRVTETKTWIDTDTLYRFVRINTDCYKEQYGSMLEFEQENIATELALRDAVPIHVMVVSVSKMLTLW